MQRHQETVFDKRGNVVPGCLITVTTLDGSLAQLWADNAKSSMLANPQITDGDGQAHWYAENGHYNIVTTQNGIEVDRRNDVVLFDPDDLAGLGDADVLLFTADDVALFQGLSSLKRPPALANPATNGELSFELTDNTLLKIKVRGSDGVVRSASIPLI